MPDDLLPLSVYLWLEEVCGRFEAAWKAAPVTASGPRIEDYLGAAAEPGRTALLRELLRLDLEYRRRHGEEPWVEDYTARFPAERRAIRVFFAELPTTSRPPQRLHAVAEHSPTTVPPRPSAQTPGDREDGKPIATAAQPQTAPAKYPVIPNYEVLGELGRGGMGVVYKARQTRLNRIVALKMILSGGHAGPHELSRFRTEAEAVARLRHPNIVQVHDMGEADGYPFLALEYCPGGTLADRLQGEPLAPTQAAQLIETLARAIHAAHQQHIVHRDLKPANILLDADGTPRIADFGLAKNLDQAGLTQTGACLGTPSYMAPEQVGIKSAVGPAVDIYALGAILYELLTGRPPFRSEAALDTMVQVLADEPVPPRQRNRGVPRNLESICLKCLQKDPQRRYASAHLLADDLRHFLDGEAVTARPLRWLGRVVRWGHQCPALAATLAAVGLFYANHLRKMALGVEGEGGLFHEQVTVLMLVWLTGATAFHWLTGRPRWSEPAVYGWATLDVLMLTAVLLVANGPQSGLVAGYFLLIGGAALRLRMRLIGLVTGLGMVSYLAVQAEASWRRPELQVEPHTAEMFVLALAMMGLIQYLLLRRFRLALAQQPR
jgi:serine/threonine-protein kinase